MVLRKKMLFKSKEILSKIEQLLENSQIQFNPGVYSSVTLDPHALEKIWKHLKQIGIRLIPINKAHITVIYTKSKPSKEIEKFDIGGYVEPQGFGIFGKGTPNQPYVLVLKVKAPTLKQAHDKMKREYNLKPTYPNYEPHITLTYDINVVFPGLKHVSEKQKKTITNIMDKLIPELPKRINILSHKIKPLNTNWS
jgi:2'-5' RNA ligase